jgi:lysophospholipase L1-like esterase
VIVRSRAWPATLGSSVAVCVLVLLTACGSPRQATGAPAAGTGVAPARTATATAGPGRTAAAAPGRPDDGPEIGIVAVRDTLEECEQQLGRVSPRVPALAVVGASYTAGVGPGQASLSWAAVLARILRWNAVIYGVPGIGFAAPSSSGLGPVSRMLEAEHLRRLHPSLVIVQAGHDDSGAPAAAERLRVRRVIEQIRAQAPQAAIALLTVFTRPGSTRLPAYRRTDVAIVAAARSADPAVIIMDPLDGRWKFAHFHGVGLHPTAAGDVQIARRVAAILGARGITAAPARSARPRSCLVSVGVPGSTGDTASGARDD